MLIGPLRFRGPGGRLRARQIPCPGRKRRGVPIRPGCCRPCSALVPSRRMTTGMRTPRSRAARTMPRATRSQRTMPPKMLTRAERTPGSAVSRAKARATASSETPPPTSRKLAGRPPARAMRSMVAMARPAPLTMQPTSPSSRMKLRPAAGGLGLLGRSLVRVGEGPDPGMAEEGVVVEFHLGVRGDEPAAGREDERVDLDERGVRRLEGAGEAGQELERLGAGGAGEPERRRRRARPVRAEIRRPGRWSA